MYSKEMYMHVQKLDSWKVQFSYLVWIICFDHYGKNYNYLKKYIKITTLQNYTV